MFNGINDSHTLTQAILLKSDNKSISDKTMKKLSEKIKNIDNYKTNYGTVKRPMDSQGFSRLSVEICDALNKIKHRAVYEKITLLLAEKALPLAKENTTTLLRNNIQSNDVSNIYDELTLPLICKSESKPGNILRSFSSVDSMLSFVEKQGNCSFKAITKMGAVDIKGESHYACIDVLKKGKKIDLVVYEPAVLQGKKQAGPDHGVQIIKETIREHISENKIKPENIRVGILEMGIQKSSYDCAIFSVSTAKNLYKDTKTSELMFSKLKNNNNGDKLTRLYEASAENRIIDPQKIKDKVELPALFLKHSSSKSGIVTTKVADMKVNKKDETLVQRIEKNYQKRGNLTYSTSIEKKRDLYLSRINSSY